MPVMCYVYRNIRYVFSVLLTISVLMVSRVCAEKISSPEVEQVNLSCFAN